jgi:sugar lactone lactonase YvrE
MPEEHLLVAGLTFPEGPRWHRGHLWFSDIRRGTVFRANLEGRLEPVVTLDDSPSGLGFLPDGTLLVVSMRHRRLLRIVDGRPEIHADLAGVTGDFLNDMVVDGDGRAYVGARSSDLYAGMAPEMLQPLDSLVIVDPDGALRVVSGLVSPNGMVISPDGATLTIAETYASRILAFDRHTDGSLSNRKVFAAVPGCYPDGICLDEAGAIWFASPYTDEVVRVLDGGQQTARRQIPGAVACALGGPLRSTLFVVAVDTAALSPPGTRPSAPGGVSQELDGGKIWSMPVPFAGAGIP